MKVKLPQIVNISARNIWRERDIVRGIFVRRHNSKENLHAVEKEVDDSAISLNPKNWVLLVEGRSKYHTLENLYLDEFIDQNRLSSSDPIVDPFTLEVAKLASIDLHLAALSVFVLEYLDSIDRNDFDEEGLRSFLDNTLHAIAKSFDISHDVLQKYFLKLPWDVCDFWDEVKLFQSTRNKLVDKSNSLSKANLFKVLDVNNHPNIFILSGILHAPVFF